MNNWQLDGGLGEDSSGDLREHEAWYVPLGHSESKVTSCHQNGDQGPLDHWPGGMHVRMGFPVCWSLPWPIVTRVVSPQSS